MFSPGDPRSVYSVSCRMSLTVGAAMNTLQGVFLGPKSSTALKFAFLCASMVPLVGSKLSAAHATRSYLFYPLNT